MKGRGNWGLVREFIVMFSGWRRLFIVIVVFVSIYGDMYFSHSVIIVFRSKRTCWEERLALAREKRNAHSILVRKSEGERLLRRPTRKLSYAVIRDIKVLGEDRDTIVVSAGMNCRGPQNDGNFLNIWRTDIFLIRILLHGVSRLCYMCHVRSNYVGNIAEDMAATDFHNREKEVKMEKKNMFSFGRVTKNM